MRPLKYIRVRAFRRNQIIGAIMAAFVFGLVLGAAWTTKQQETYQRYETQCNTEAWRSSLVEP